MNTIFLILIAMIFCHIADDFYLQKQGCLADLKQKKWWENNCPDKLYKYDYIVALFAHSFSWAFSIMIIPVLYVNNLYLFEPIMLFIINILVHMLVDDMKANKNTINLIQDQCIHLLQIFLTWFCLLF